MGTWLDHYNPSPAVRAKLGKMNDEWAAIDKRLEAEPTPAERDELLGRIDEIEYEIDEAVRGPRIVGSNVGSFGGRSQQTPINIG